MMSATLYLEPSGPRIGRWLGAAALVISLHAAIAISAMWWPREEPGQRRFPGAVMIDLAELAAESPSDQPDISQEPQFQTSAPPPQPLDDIEQTPPPEAQTAQQIPVEPQQEVATAVPQEAEPMPPQQAPETEELPKVDEAPLAPNPEVVLPQKEPETRETKAEEQRVSEPPPAKPVRQPTEEKSDRQRAQKSNSQTRRQAAASAKGAFDPNPIYRANPQYPASALSNRIEGVVVVSYSVSASGSVTNVSVLSASPPGVFNSATIAAVSQWRFKPSGQAVHGRRTTIRFKLK